MTILAVDTSADLASVAIRHSNSTVAEIGIPSQEGHAQIIFPAIQQALNQAGLTLTDIDCFAAAYGPGSFTGVRVALSIIKGLAEACGKPATGISNLRALSSLGTARLRSPVIDARRGEYYAAVYDADCNLVQQEAVVSLDAWKAALDAEVEIIIQLPSTCLAAAVAFCAELDGPESHQDPAFLDARYIRRNDADSFWREP